MKSWLSSSLKRFYPASQAVECDALSLEAARGERLSFQVVFRTEEADMQVTAGLADTSLPVRIRRVGYVPMPHLNTSTPLDEVEGVGHIPGWVPDPLFDENTVHAGPHETNAFWISVEVPRDIDPGTYPVTVALSYGEESATLTAQITAHKAVISPRQDFPVTHWFYADSLCDWYKVEPFEEAFWLIVEKYFADVAAHGQDTVYIPMFTPPLDGVKRPTQLLGVKKDGKRYTFDWTLVRRWIRTAQSQGVRNFEWTHPFTQWGVKYAIRVYENHNGGELLWPVETGATSDTYRNFLSQLLPELQRFVQDEGVMERSFFHVSDEPHGDEHVANYKAAREMLLDLAPWMKVMDALSDIRFAREGLTDLPIPSISVAPDFVKEGVYSWAYFCCGPRDRFLNRLLDTPLQKIRMSGWLFYRLGAKGFLHWGYNYWYISQTRTMIDPFKVSDGGAWPGWAYGDTFMVYPGPEGPIDSLRWEVFAESLQDFALLQSAGADREDPMLGEITDYAVFPRNEEWITDQRSKLLAKLDEMM